MKNALHWFRDWVIREPIYFSQLVALVTAGLSALVSKWVAGDYNPQVSLLVYAVLSMLGVKPTRDIVDGPVTAAAKDRELRTTSTKWGKTMMELDSARALLREHLMNPGDRTELRTKTRTFLDGGAHS